MHTLPKSERLCSRKQIAALMTEGSVVFHFPFKLFFMLAPPVPDESRCRMTVNAPKRSFKRAVSRNLLKRRMREAFRKNKTPLYMQLEKCNQSIIIFFHYVSPEILAYDSIESAMQQALSKLANIVAQSGDISVSAVD